MAYRITYGSSVVYEAGSESRAVHDAKTSLSAEGISTFDFTVPPTHPLVGSFSVNDMSHLVDLTFDGRLLFRGIVTRLSTDMNGEVTVHCDSEIVELSWVMGRSSTPSLRTASELMSWCISILNQSGSSASVVIDDDDTIVLGGDDDGPIESVGSDWMGYCPISSSDPDVGYPSTEKGAQVVAELPASPTDLLSLLVDSFVTKYGCILYVDYERYQGYKTLTVKKPTASTAAQTIRFGENLTDYLQEVTTEETYTACYPVGGNSVVGGSLSTPVRLYYPAYAGDTSAAFTTTGGDVEVKSGDRFVFGSSSRNGKWSVEAAGNYHIDSTSSWGVDFRTPLLDDVSANSSVDVYGRAVQDDPKTVTLAMISDRTENVDGRTYKKVGGVVYDVAAEGAYGVKMMALSDSDELLAGDLLFQAIYELRQRVRPQVTIEIQGVDMAMYSSGKSHLRAGDSVRVVSEPHDIDEVMIVRKISLNLDNPAQNKYSIGKAMTTATGQIRGAYGEAASVREKFMRQYR